MWAASQIDGPIAILAPAVDGAPAAFAPGYHLNVDPTLFSPELEAYRVFPAEPAQVFAGDAPAYQTVFLRFADEAEARVCLPLFWRGDRAADEPPAEVEE
ncbi:MAG TPA: hypothetical protein VGD10_08130 [Allosphingosinicella sp.]|uniref:hypothetical protein n=1 Tax=Allosphingosinicella sp. TaxID=2823234 RepID=UPI002EDB6D85